MQFGDQTIKASHFLTTGTYIGVCGPVHDADYDGDGGWGGKEGWGR